jgi:5'-methylthioadenosine phosphorylase
MEMSKIGIIGGSGLYKIDGIKDIKETAVKTPFGAPSGKLITGLLDGNEVVFLPRHGKGHTVLPSELNYRANIYAMKKLGVDAIISVSAVGSLKTELKPLDIVIIDQFVDRTNQARKTTFFGDGIVAHVGFARPVCGSLAGLLYRACKEEKVATHKGGTYVNMEGPMFSTLAESKLFKSWGMDVIGMTNMPEARLAREAGICYSTMAMVTDYDCWHAEEVHETVTVEMIIENLNKNTDNAKRIVRRAIAAASKRDACDCAESLKYAIITAPDAIPAARKRELDIIIGKYIK